MYILVQAHQFENNEDTIYRIQAPELEEKYQQAGYQKRERSYKLSYQHRDYTVLCPEYRSAEMGVEPIVLLPSFLSLGGRTLCTFIYMP